MDIQHNVELLAATNEEWTGKEANRHIERGVLAYNTDTGEWRTGPGVWATCVPYGVDIDLVVDSVATSNLTIATGLNDGDTVGGKVMATGETALLIGETAGATNGPYTIAASPARKTGFTTFDSIAGKCFYVRGGTHAGKFYRCYTAAGGTLGTTVLEFVQVNPRTLNFGKLNQTAGLTVTSTVIPGTKFFCEDPTSKEIQVVSAATMKTYFTAP